MIKHISATKTSIIKLLACMGLMIQCGTAYTQDAEMNVEPALFMAMTEKVKDFDQWAKSFGDVAGKGGKYGVFPVGFARDANDPNSVIVGYAVLDVEKAKTYTRSEETKTDLQNLGVVGDPEVRFFTCLDEIDDDSGNKNFVILTHKVKNYDQWRKRFFATEAERLIAGLKYVGIVHTIDKPDEISVILTTCDPKLSKEYFESAYLTKGMADAGIIGKPDTHYYILNIPNATEPEKEDPAKAANKLTLRITTNVKCTYSMNNADQGTLIFGRITRVYLPKGKYSFLFKSASNPADSLRINYTADKVNAEDIMNVDLQAVIHKRIVKERSPKDVVDIKKQEANPYDMVLVKGGSFKMGTDSMTSEMKAHTVTVKDFYISQYELTQKQWTKVMGTSPSHFKNCDNCPVENVSYDDAIAFIQKLNGMTGLKYRLPTEAEWEYAAKGGSESKHYTFSGGDNLQDVAWCYSNSNNETHPVGQKKANELGLYDMTGNVFEWCSDWFSYTYYKDGPTNNPTGPDHGQWKVLRGGSWGHDEKESLPVYRIKDEPSNRGRRTGFRLARDK